MVEYASMNVHPGGLRRMASADYVMACDASTCSAVCLNTILS
jgi:hypothetical protein